MTKIVYYPYYYDIFIKFNLDYTKCVCQIKYSKIITFIVTISYLACLLLINNTNKVNLEKT